MRLNRVLMITALALLAAGGLAACQTQREPRPLTTDIEPPPRFAEATPTSCRAAEGRFALGRTITAPLLEEMRQRAGARMGRTVAVGDAPSTDVDATRLNVDIEPTGRIVGVRCG